MKNKNVDGNFVACLYKKYQLRGKFYVLVPQEVLCDCVFDFDTNQLISPDGNIYYHIEDAKLLERSEDIFFDYPLDVSVLSRTYRTSNRKKIKKKYFQELKQNLMYAFYDKKSAQIQSIITSIPDIKKADMDSWWYGYGNSRHLDDVEGYQTFHEIQEMMEEENDAIVIERPVLDQVIHSLDKGEFNKVQAFFSEAKRDLDDSNSEIIPTSSSAFLEKVNIRKALEQVEPYLLKLESLVGLQNVKRVVHQLVRYLVYLDKVEDMAQLDNPRLHMFFTGNPGTGKTTVARILAKILYQLGYVTKEDLAEVTTQDLIGGYVGQTAIKTRNVIKRNQGGVVFVDEAYSFASDAQEFGDESLVEIIKEMDEGSTVFIFAGYKDEMDHFMNMNPGLKSRLQYYLDYSDYTLSELYQIFELRLQKSRLVMDMDAKEKVLELMESVLHQKNFGNGRFVDKLFSSIVMKHASRVSDSDDKDTLMRITLSDVSVDVDDLLYKREKKPMGFCYQKR